MQQKLPELRGNAANVAKITLSMAQRSTTWRILALVAGCALTPAVAHAAVVTGGADPTQIVNSIATFILGPFGEALAVLALVGVGISFMIGAAGFRLIGGVIVGLIIMFGASYLVTTFIGGAA